MLREREIFLPIFLLIEKDILFFNKNIIQYLLEIIKFQRKREKAFHLNISRKECFV